MSIAVKEDKPVALQSLTHVRYCELLKVQITKKPSVDWQHLQSREWLVPM